MTDLSECCSENPPEYPCSCKACKVHGNNDHQGLTEELIKEMEDNYG